MEEEKIKKKKQLADLIELRMQQLFQEEGVNRKSGEELCRSENGLVVPCPL
jgi:hypothetical protein